MPSYFDLGQREPKSLHLSLDFVNHPATIATAARPRSAPCGFTRNSEAASAVAVVMGVSVGLIPRINYGEAEDVPETESQCLHFPYSCGC